MSRLLKGGLAAALLAGSALAVSAEPATYASPEELVGAIVAALEARDRDALLVVFGPENEDMILTGDPEQDRENWGEFLAAYREMNRIAIEAGGNARLYLGLKQTPVAVAIVPTADGRWTIDPAATQNELADYTIGRNELDAMDAMRRYVEIQRDYRAVDHDEDGVMEFAASILSSPGSRDGLNWPVEGDGPVPPVGDRVARSSFEGFSVDGRDVEPEPFVGYYFKILQKQGPNAPGGAYDYLVNGNMVAGHALLAVPSDYGSSGVMSFMVGENGEIFEADLGDDTLEKAVAIESFDPGEGWSPAD
jgi:hypothetical protein